MQLSKEFINYTSTILGTERWERFIKSFEKSVPCSVRMNPWKKGNVFPFKNATEIPWCKDGYWLEERPQFNLDPLLHAGVYYVQEAGSMFLDRVLRQYIKEPVSALDLCAAPGGKSTLMRAALPKDSVMISNEVDARRANILAENLIKQGHKDVIVTNNKPCDYKKSKLRFDLILADVPCSGEGMFRRDEGAIKEWSVQNVQHSQERQRVIIKEIWDNLRVGGLLIYSTCTFNLHENEENVRWIQEELNAKILPVSVKENWNITGSLLEGWKEPIYRFIPGTTNSEGLFMAVLQKLGDDELAMQSKATPPEILREKVKESKLLYVISDGIPMPTQKGKDSIPSHAEALSLDAQLNKYPMVELSLEDARKYLHREAIRLPAETPLGYVIVSYLNHPLGFMKNMGNRANNLYPKEWAIRNL